MLLDSDNILDVAFAFGLTVAKAEALVSALQEKCTALLNVKQAVDPDAE
jgi:hypothetical protein